MSWLEPSAERIGSRHVQVFLPSVDRYGGPIPRGQRYWVSECLRVLAELFGGATAFPPAQGVWRDDERNGELVYDETVIAFSYVHPELLTTEAADVLMSFLQRLGTEGKQGEVGVFVDGVYYGFQDFCGDDKDPEPDAENSGEEGQK